MPNAQGAFKKMGKIKLKESTEQKKVQELNKKREQILECLNTHFLSVSLYISSVYLCVGHFPWLLGLPSLSHFQPEGAPSNICRPPRCISTFRFSCLLIFPPEVCCTFLPLFIVPLFFFLFIFLLFWYQSQ